jgi:DNA-binding FrmR family transcriptional regulator
MATRGYSPGKDQLLKRLARVEGQVRGVARMIEEDRWCPDVLQQIAAVTAALDKVALGLAEGHVQHCMAAAGEDAGRRQEMTTELMQALGRLVR